MSQSLVVYLVWHPPSSDESLAKSLIVVVEVENQALNQHVIWAIPSGITKLSQSQAGVVGDASPNAK